MRFSLALFVSVFAATSLAAVEQVSHPQMDLLTRQWNCGQINGKRPITLYKGPGPLGPKRTTLIVSSGNCYENDCGGEYSRDGVTCTTGQYAGCECGYNCGPVVSLHRMKAIQLS